MRRYRFIRRLWIVSFGVILASSACGNGGASSPAVTVPVIATATEQQRAAAPSVATPTQAPISKPTLTPATPTAVPSPEATIAPPPLNTGKVLWNDDFSSGISSSWSVIDGDWQTSNGYAVPTSEANNSLMVGGDLAWKNYMVEATINRFSALYYSGGILVRVQDSENYMRARAFDSVLDSGSYWEIVRNGKSEVVPGTEFHHQMSQPPYSMKVVVAGSTYQLYINGELQSSFTDKTFDSGYVGLQSFGKIGMQPHRAGFGKFKVTEK